MKRRINADRDLLGLSQTELAIILKVSQSQLAMYEGHLRNLPLAADLLLSQMILHCIKHDEGKPVLEKNDSEQLKIEKKRLERDLENNHYEQLKLEKVIGKLEKKKEIQLKRRRLVLFFTERQEKFSVDLVNYLIDSTTLTFTDQDALELTKCFEKEQLLQFKQQMLKSAMQRLEKEEK